MEMEHHIGLSGANLGHLWRKIGLVETRVDPTLFALSHDFVGDLAETAALIWPAPAAFEQAPPPTLSDPKPPLGAGRVTYAMIAAAKAPPKKLQRVDVIKPTPRPAPAAAQAQEPVMDLSHALPGKSLAKLPSSSQQLQSLSSELKQGQPQLALQPGIACYIPLEHGPGGADLFGDASERPAQVPLSQAIMMDIFPPEKRGQAMAIWGMGVMLGPIMGPTLGGWLTETYSWRWVFLINLPFGIATVLGLMAFMPDSKPRDMRFDWFGFITLSVFIGVFQLMLDRGETLSWFESNEIIVEAVIAGAAAYLFLAHTATADRTRKFMAYLSEGWRGYYIV